ncbi:hypothetical protein ACIBSW_22345 [Actinoplanes sp. NPDC049668]|uniref:hypothetical protein n=1 Tax=unclassified Actinoplanes TaxID=2626549 RepID=UPI0033A26C13
MQQDLVLRGLAENPVIPADVLVRLLHRRPEPVAAGLGVRAVLPIGLQEQMAGHRMRRVRGAVAGHARLAPAIRDRLLDDPDWRVRARVFTRREQQPPLTGEALVRLMTGLLDPPDDSLFTDSELFEELFFADRNRIVVAARHPDPRVRRFAATYAWRDDLRFLRADPDPRVAAAAAASIAEHERIMMPADLPGQHCHAFWWVLHRPLSRALAEQVAAGDDVEAVSTIATNPTLAPTVVDTLSRHRDAEVRACIAGREVLTAAQVVALVGDRSPAVRAVVATRTGLTREQVALLAADPDDAVRRAVATHAYVSEEERAVLAGTADLTEEQALRWAGSENPRLRRRAAQRPDLPAETVAALAADPDAGVRANLALNHPEAPGELLLSCFLEDPDRKGLLTLPQFPRAGLSRLADHADPHVRLLAARDPDADPAVIAHLTTDPHVRVRKAMARCPRLPADRVTALLDDAELAADAAANPSLDWKPVVEALCEIQGSGEGSAQIQSHLLIGAGHQRDESHVRDAPIVEVVRDLATHLRHRQIGGAGVQDAPHGQHGAVECVADPEGLQCQPDDERRCTEAVEEHPQPRPQHTVGRERSRR